MYDNNERNVGKKRIGIDTTLQDMRDFGAELNSDPSNALKLVTDPRKYLNEKGLIVHPGLGVSLMPVRELRGRLGTEEGIRSMVSWLRDGPSGRYHIMNGDLQCLIINIEIEVENVADVIGPIDEIPIGALLSIIDEKTNVGPDSLNTLLSNPSEFFEPMGIKMISKLQFAAWDTEKMLSSPRLREELLISLEQSIAEIHLHKIDGDNKCKVITISFEN